MWSVCSGAGEAESGNYYYVVVCFEGYCVDCGGYWKLGGGAAGLELLGWSVVDCCVG